jgi:hypothetical protein
LAPRTNKHVRNRDLEVYPKSNLPKVGEPENVYGFGLARPSPHSRVHAHFRLAGSALGLAGEKKRDFGFDDSTTLPCSE